MIRVVRPAAAIVAFACCCGAAAQADTPSPVAPDQPAIALSNVRVSLSPLVTIPPESDGSIITSTPPLARILYSQSPPDSSGRMFINDINGVLFQTNQIGAAPTPYLDLRTQNIGFTAGVDPGSPGFNGFAFNPNFNGDPAKPG